MNASIPNGFQDKGFIQFETRSTLFPISGKDSEEFNYILSFRFYIALVNGIKTHVWSKPEDCTESECAKHFNREVFEKAYSMMLKGWKTGDVKEYLKGLKEDDFQPIPGVEIIPLKHPVDMGERKFLVPSFHIPEGSSMTVESLFSLFHDSFLISTLCDLFDCKASEIAYSAFSSGDLSFSEAALISRRSYSMHLAKGRLRLAKEDIASLEDLRVLVGMEKWVLERLVEFKCKNAQFRVISPRNLDDMRHFLAGRHEDPSVLCYGKALEFINLLTPKDPIYAEFDC